jgi:rubrerythrin
MNNSKIDISRTNLAKLYKRVMICKLCKKIYGSDLSDKKEDRICPICMKKIIR